MFKVYSIKLKLKILSNKFCDKQHKKPIFNRIFGNKLTLSMKKVSLRPCKDKVV